MRLPVHCLDRIQQYKRFCSSFQVEYGREPSEHEISCFMGLTLGQVGEIKKSACIARVSSLDMPVKGLDGGEDTTVGELVPSRDDLESEAVERMTSAQLCTVLWECVDSLPGQQPEVIRRRYRDGQTLREIGEAQGITPEAVRQIHSKALRELRKPSRAAQLRPFLPEADCIYSRSKILQSDELEAQRLEHLKLLDRVRQSVAISQQEGD